MPESLAARGTRRGLRMLAELGADLRSHRAAAGLSLAVVARAAGISPSELSRIERGLSPWLDIVTATRLAAVVGLDLSVRAYPGGEPLRDAGHNRLIAAFAAHVAPSLHIRSEVPIGNGLDQRAWDQIVSDDNASAAVEFETRLTDAQALTRRITLKMRDAGIDRVVLVLADTRANRSATVAAGALLRPVFPLDTHEVLASLRAGRIPRAGGIVFLRPVSPSSAPCRLRPPRNAFVRPVTPSSAP